MNKSEYLENIEVKQFVDWLKPKLNNKGEFIHSYIMKRPKGKKWQCVSILNAYENYSWPFNVNIGSEPIIKGSSFSESKVVLNMIRLGMLESMEENNIELFRNYCISILQWGGVLNSNKDKLIAMQDSIIKYFNYATKKLEPLTVNTNDNFSEIVMNSGFTKIYSMLLKNFSIYDGRVGATLALLVRLYLEESKISNIPYVLKFAYGDAKVNVYNKNIKNRRNPNNAQFKFPRLTNNSKLHIDNNIRANWLIKHLSEVSEFKNLDNPARALESALFMIGYDVSQN